ncbi:ABC transporter [Azotobacter vinelandii CA]|uniref:ABC transporter n=2 Tax=Azotobacter vinelandii TaxID=354 RepID=C1DJ02_AZOVD|nr:ABC transporter ATP-binding protein [Azotobacter vinelandii]ACO80821.1 ABC transporter [Azotobacter vinelandii DJ]AGK14262.1 ABC transporter [Azotobacter vinelandii CA]AGK22178.1 ABC transporter [Azotobacter vinelandii CA6]SFX02557.1 iron complex transport system ATP-binding protein [Azotobacter vinelandii]GLK60703.1 iron ABC transporter ATP-binding protein [Azotobacter vinelandii]
MLEVQALACGYGHRSILENLSFTLEVGELLCLLGPNGVGKTTLFKTILGLLPPRAGEIRLDGRPTRHWSRREFARWVGYVPQAHTPPFPFQVEDVVAMGRTAHGNLFSGPGQEDREVAAEALETLGISALAKASYTEISGGERQLVLIARALAQQPRILVMDEPTSNLDYGNQLKVMGHVRRIADAGRMGVILTTHHPDHALLHASRVLALDRERHWRIGRADEVVSEDYLRRTYGVETEIHDIRRRDGGRSRLCVPAVGPGEPP